MRRFFDEKRLVRAVVPSALVITALWVWLTHPDKTFVFDGVMFAQIVERSIEEWRNDLLNPRHLLFNPFFQILRDGLGPRASKSTLIAYSKRSTPWPGPPDCCCSAILLAG